MCLKSIPNLKCPDGSFTSTDYDCAEELNRQFASVFTVDNGKIPHLNMLPNYDGSVTDVLFTRKNILESLMSFSDLSACGPDEIPARFLKTFALNLSVPLEIIFNESFVMGQIPKQWLDAIVVPVYKKGNDWEAVNYRPISLTSIVCKAMEKILKNHMISFLEQNNFISNRQFGFLKGRSTQMQMLECTNLWSSFLDKGQSVDIIYLDIAKAFDSVSHAKLLLKLERYGFRGRWLDWFRAFLFDRKQRVRVRDSFSDTLSVTSGVPQGSVLGPVFFMLYINDLPLVVSQCYVRIYADDTRLFRRVSDDNDFQLLCDDLNNVSRWANTWQLNISFPKCNVVHLGAKNARNNYVIDGVNIVPTDMIKDLGTFVSETFSFGPHISKIVSKANSQIGYLLRRFVCRDVNFMMKLYKTYIRPLVERDCVVWKPCNVADINLLESVQRNFTRRIIAVSSMSYDDRLNALHLCTLELRRLRFDLIEVYKIVHGLSGLSFDDFCHMQMLMLLGDLEGILDILSVLLLD